MFLEKQGLQLLELPDFITWVGTVAGGGGKGMFPCRPFVWVAWLTPRAPRRILAGDASSGHGSLK